MKALVSELKIMVHLGQHLNIVNLLGAVTRDIAQCKTYLFISFVNKFDIYYFLLFFSRQFNGNR